MKLAKWLSEYDQFDHIVQFYLCKFRNLDQHTDQKCIKCRNGGSKEKGYRREKV